MKEKTSYMIRMGKGYKGVGAMSLGLPDGRVKKMNRMQKDTAAPDYPAVEAQLTEEQKRNYERYGLTVEPITTKTTSSSKRKTKGTKA